MLKMIKTRYAKWRLSRLYCRQDWLSQFIALSEAAGTEWMLDHQKYEGELLSVNKKIRRLESWTR